MTAYEAYLHEALGGCFGPGCRIAFGYDFVGDDYGTTSPAVTKPKPEPLATCFGGFHGTHVAGIVGMDVPLNSSLFPGLVGVAPDAGIGMYRVFGCQGSASGDIVVAALQRAADGGAHVVSMSIGSYGPYGGYPYSPLPAAVASLRKKGIPVIAAAGNDGSYQSFSTQLPGNADGALAIASAENAEFPTYPTRDSNGAELRYGALYPFPEGEYPVVFARHDANSTFGCSASDYPSASALDRPVSEYIVAVPRGLCAMNLLQQVAASANFSYVLTYPDYSRRNVFVENYGLAAPAITADGSIYAYGSTVGDVLAKVAQGAQPYTLTIGPPTPKPEPQIGGGQPNKL